MRLPPVERAPVPVETALVAAARRGDRGALGELYRRHGRLVQSIALARVPVDAAADLVQDVFVMAMGRLGSLRDDAAFAPWLATIARRRAADWRRRAHDTVPLEEASAEAMVEGDPARGPCPHAALGCIPSPPQAYRATPLPRFVAGPTR